MTTQLSRAVLASVLTLGVVAGLITGLGAGTTSAATAAPAVQSAPAVQAAATVQVARTAAKKRKRWKPARGPVFNDPTASAAKRGIIATRIKQAIQHTPRGATIRFAAYSFDRGDVVKLLGLAHRRGVHVQVVLNDNVVSEDALRLQRRLGKNPRKKSFVVICRGSCRSGGGNLHMKVFSFSRAGAAKGLVISSSANLTWGAGDGQWNDAFITYGDAKLHRTWVRVFDQLKLDRRATPRRVTYTTSSLQAAFQRTQASATGGVVEGTPTGIVEDEPAGAGAAGERRATSDAVLRRLQNIRCDAPRRYGRGGRTEVRIIMYAWYGDRGMTLAKRVAHLKRAGCNVRVIGSVISDPVVRTMKGAGIPVRAADWDWGRKMATDGSREVYGSRCYSHLKVLAVNGRYNGKATRSVWTGSENWSAVSFVNDEVTLRVTGLTWYRRYLKRFNTMWSDKDATHATGIEPRRRPCA